MSQLVRDFAVRWKAAIEGMNSELMRSFSNFKNGTQILQVGEICIEFLLYIVKLIVFFYFFSHAYSDRNCVVVELLLTLLNISVYLDYSLYQTTLSAQTFAVFGFLKLLHYRTDN